MAELWPGGPIELPHQITIDGIELTLPAIPTPELLYLVATQSWWQLLPNAVDPEQAVPLMERIHDAGDHFDFEHLWDPAILVLGRAAGIAPRKASSAAAWWAAVRVAGNALGEWPLFSAWCARHDVDITGGPLWKVVAAAYAWLRDQVAPQDLAKLEQQIWAPPPFAPAAAPEELPEHVRAEEAALALAALRESLPGEQQIGEWVVPPAPQPPT